jgi:prepilin-type N-terminal cleavage/methylation domain-containing protein
VIAMVRPSRYPYAGMTLVELLVVLVIMGLLTVTVIPLLVGNRDKKSIKNAADAAESAFAHVATKAMTSPNGAAVWLETGTSGGGAGLAVTSIGTARVPAVAYGTTTITQSAAAPATDVSVLLSMASSFVADLPAPIEFAGVPGVFTAKSITTVTSSNTSVTGAVNRTAWNSPAPPASAAAVPYRLHLPPRQSSLAASTSLSGGAAIDLSASQIGLGGSAISLGGFRRVAIEYDRTGCPAAAWMSSLGVGGGWTREVLTPAKPLILAIGMQDQAGVPWKDDPTEDDPGASWQSPFSRWLIVDPRNGGVRVIEAGSAKGAADSAAAFAIAIGPVVEDFKNSRNSQR